MKCRLYDTAYYRSTPIYPGDSGKRWIRLEKVVDLPFVPSKGIQLGLLSYSTLNNDTHTVDEVCWNCVKNEFHVDLKSCPFEFQAEDLPNKLFPYLVEEGWDLEMATGSSIESMRGCVDFNDYALIKMGNNFANVSKESLEYLKLRDQPFEVVELIAGSE